jgi:hypothetical protein
MNSQLVEGLRQLPLKPGESSKVEVDGRVFVIHEEGAEGPSVYEGQMMMLPWFDSPRHPAGTTLAVPGKLPPPDPVIVPRDEEEGA